MGMISVFAGAMAGACIGVVFTSFAVAAKKGDEQNAVFEMAKRETADPVPPVSSERSIRFTDPNGMLLFTIPDGACVYLMYGNGERVAGICHYLDMEHAEINGIKWKMTEFAQQMQIRGIVFSPSVLG